MDRPLLLEERQEHSALHAAANGLVAWFDMITRTGPCNTSKLDQPTQFNGLNLSTQRGVKSGHRNTSRQVNSQRGQSPSFQTTATALSLFNPPPAAHCQIPFPCPHTRTAIYDQCASAEANASSLNCLDLSLSPNSSVPGALLHRAALSHHEQLRHPLWLCESELNTFRLLVVEAHPKRLTVLRDLHPPIGRHAVLGSQCLSILPLACLV